MLFLPNQCICVCANCHRKIHANKLKPLNAAIDYNSLIDIANEIGVSLTDKQLEFLDEYSYLLIKKVLSAKDEEPVKHILKDVLGVGYE